MRLKSNLKTALGHKDILLMTHIVLGYPSFEANREVVRQMVEGGVDLIEMQIPFSEPMADGPVIIRANQESLARGTKVRQCLEFAAEMVATHPIPFLFMTYYNILFKFGEADFFAEAAKIGIQGLIVPDLPPEEGASYLALAREHEIAPILIFAPTSTDERMRELARVADGFIYCVARRGVTGSATSFDEEFYRYIARCRTEAGDLPLAVGFGIRNREDVAALKGRAEIAVIGSETIRLVDEMGPEAVGPFIAGLR
jgi:tryptophan synthase alpha chain